MTDAELIRAYDKARSRRNNALDALKELHADLLKRTRAASGSLKTPKGYAAISFTTTEQKDKARIAELVADGTIRTKIKRIEKLTVVAT